MNIQTAIDRLNSQLPLQARQAQLSSLERQLHQAILWSLVRQGRPPTSAEMVEIVGAGGLSLAIQTLGQHDLVVLDASGSTVVGAYPLTTEITAHHLHIGNHTIYAMCALDAVAVAPMFDTTVQIDSNCHVSGAPLQIQMRGHEVMNADPPGPVIGIRWQMPCGVAAHSMCTEMVFLKDNQTAQAWQDGESDTISLFDLADAIAFGTGFFLPLLDA